MLLFLETSSQVYFALSRWRGESAGLSQCSKFPSVMAPQTARIKHIQLQRCSSVEMAQNALPRMFSLGRDISGLWFPQPCAAPCLWHHPGCVTAQHHLRPSLEAVPGQLVSTPALFHGPEMQGAQRKTSSAVPMQFGKSCLFSTVSTLLSQQKSIFCCLK